MSVVGLEFNSSSRYSLGPALEQCLLLGSGGVKVCFLESF